MPIQRLSCEGAARQLRFSFIAATFLKIAFLRPAILVSTVPTVFLERFTLASSRHLHHQAGKTINVRFLANDMVSVCPSVVPSVPVHREERNECIKKRATLRHLEHDFAARLYAVPDPSS